MCLTKRKQTKGSTRINILFIGCFLTFALDFLLFVLLIVKAPRDCCSLFKVSVYFRDFAVFQQRKTTYDYKFLRSQTALGFIVVSAYYLCSFHFKDAQLPCNKKPSDCVTMENTLITSHLVSFIFLCVVFSLLLLHEWITCKTSSREDDKCDIYCSVNETIKIHFVSCLFFFSQTRFTVCCFN